MLPRQWNHATMPRRGNAATNGPVVERIGVDDVDGVVERVRTGEKARFRGVDALGPTIRRMLGIEIPDARVDASDDLSRGTSMGEATNRGHGHGGGEPRATPEENT